MFVGFNPTCTNAATGRTMNNKSSKPSQKRRAILQGSLAAPVVLTVSSARAAQMTTVGKCMANIGEQKPANVLHG